MMYIIIAANLTVLRWMRQLLCHANSWDRVGREPYFHVSSPANGWQGNNPRPHADFIDPTDFPECWKGFDFTVDVEAKAKELAVLELKKELDIREKNKAADRRPAALL